jgi:hypothetical protein
VTEHNSLGRPRLGAAAIAFAGALVFASGCTGGASKVSTDGGPSSRVLVPEATAKAEIAKLRATVPPSQASALADGVVTLTEYEAAETRQVACLKAGLAALSPPGSGLTIQIIGPTLSADDFAYTYSTRFVGEPMPDFEASPRVERSCFDANLGAVEQAYQLRLLSDRGYVDTKRKGFDGCLTSKGAAPGPDPHAAIRADQARTQGGSEAFHECVGKFPSMNALPLASS